MIGKTRTGFIAAFLALSMAGCAPNLARTNARIEKGAVHAGLGLAYTQSVGGTHQSGGDSRDANESLMHGELDVQFGGRNEETNLGWAVQLKAAIGAWPGVDVYVECPSSGDFYYGLGAEIGGMNGGYWTGSYYFGKEIFLTFTGRALVGTKETGLFNPQLAFGWSSESGRPSLALFSGYVFVTGPGMEMNFCMDNCTTHYANHLVYGGVSIRF